MQNDTRVDLHLHTTASDGTWSPKKLIEKVVEARIGIIAVTDHDSVKNVREAGNYAKCMNISFITGVEISSSLDGMTYHILGLGIDPDNPDIQQLVSKNSKMLEEHNGAGIRYLEGKYPHVSYNEYLEFVENPEDGGWKSLNYLIHKGLCTNYKSFFSLLSDWNDSSSRVDFPSPDIVIQTVRKAGGVPVLAHPGSKMYGDDAPKTIQLLYEAGIGGIECFHPENSSEATNYSIRFCRDHNLCITGGSDCHGDFVGSRRLLHPPVKLSMLNLEGIRIL